MNSLYEPSTIRGDPVREEMVLDVMRDAVMTVITVSGPLLLIALAVGLLVSIFQTITSIQEQTLTFVPKILAVFLGIYFLSIWMVTSVVELFQRLMESIGPMING